MRDNDAIGSPDQLRGVQPVLTKSTFTNRSSCFRFLEAAVFFFAALLMAYMRSTGVNMDAERLRSLPPKQAMRDIMFAVIGPLQRFLRVLAHGTHFLRYMLRSSKFRRASIRLAVGGWTRFRGVWTSEPSTTQPRSVVRSSNEDDPYFECSGRQPCSWSNGKSVYRSKGKSEVD